MSEAEQKFRANAKSTPIAHNEGDEIEEQQDISDLPPSQYGFESEAEQRGRANAFKSLSIVHNEGDALDELQDVSDLPPSLSGSHDHIVITKVDGSNDIISPY
jgi:hypothetical protein